MGKIGTTELLIVLAIVLVITSVRMSREKVQPKGCGVHYDREER